MPQSCSTKKSQDDQLIAQQVCTPNICAACGAASASLREYPFVLYRLLWGSKILIRMMYQPTSHSIPYSQTVQIDLYRLVEQVTPNDESDSSLGIMLVMHR